MRACWRGLPRYFVIGLIGVPSPHYGRFAQSDAAGVDWPPIELNNGRVIDDKLVQNASLMVSSRTGREAIINTRANIKEHDWFIIEDMYAFS